ncbi:hypothetical protein Tco_0204134 [Tanacetum coccineum]
MVAYLEKLEGSEGFHQIIDFLTISHIHYALTKSPILYASPIQQFWQTAKLCTTEDEVMSITATIDRKAKITVLEASIRRHLKLEDSEGITSLRTAEIFKKLDLMGTYPTPALTNKLFSNIRRASKGYSGEAAPMPYDSPLQSVHSLGRDEGSLSLNELMDLVTKLKDRVKVLDTKLQQTKKTYSTALTKLILRVKKLENNVKSDKPRRRARIVILDDEDAIKDSSKQGRMIEDIDENTSTILVTPIKISSQSDQSEDHLKVLSAAKVLADAARKKREVANVTPYTRRKKTVSTTGGDISTAGASKPVSTAGEFQEKETSTPSPAVAKDKGKAIMQEPEPPKKIKKKAALELQRKLDEREGVTAEATQAPVIDWSDPSILRYHILQNRPYSGAEVRKNMVMYLKNQGGYKMSFFKGMSYEDIRPIFGNVWDQIQSFVPMDSEKEKDSEKKAEGRLKRKYGSTRPGFDDLILWGDMKVMFEPDEDFAVWKNHHSQELIEWKLYDSCGVHSLMQTEVIINMLVEKKYPLPQDTLARMLWWKLHVNNDVTKMAYEILRFTRSQLYQQ